MSTRRRDEAGAVAVLVAISATVLFVLASLVVDLGLARDTRRDSQNAADASALAAANRLYSTGTLDLAAATSAAKDYALTNFNVPLAQWNGCTDDQPLPVLAAGTGCISYDSATAPQRVRVRIPGVDVDTPFGSFAGTSKVNVGSYAEAILTSSSGGPCGLCILGSGEHDFGTTNLYATNTSVMLNGTLCAKKDFQVSPAPPNKLDVQGGVKTSNGCKSSGVAPYPVGTGSNLVDPLASLAMPTTAGWPNKGAQNPCSGGPGIYSTFNNANSCSLSPGLYVITGATSVSGNGHDLKGTGVTLYLACGTPAAIVACTSANSKDFDMTSQNVHLNLVAATTATATNRAIPGVAIMADRGWTGTLSFQGGGGGGTTQGAIYLAKGTMHYGGNSDGAVLDSLVVVNDFAGNGNSATLSVTNTGANVPDAGPKSPALYK
ncbi:MAG: pilus assembly protein TadG-related protein [Marmoricola sp.]